MTLFEITFSDGDVVHEHAPSKAALIRLIKNNYNCFGYDIVEIDE